MRRTLRETITDIRDALIEGRQPEATPEELPCFTPQALEGNPGVSPDDLARVLASLGPEDVPTFDAALERLDSDEPAWLGFKIVTDPVQAVGGAGAEASRVVDTGASEGSADALCGVFVATEDKQIIYSRPYSHRDSFQMLDVTRGPHMHNEQFPGIAWLSLPLERDGIVYVFGAGEVTQFIERMAQDCGFETVVIDDDATYLNEKRLPHSRRILIESFKDIPALGVTAADYVLVLTRGHVYDPEALAFGIEAGAHYVGMMGRLEKNERVFQLAEARGIPREKLEATHTPIGLKFGAKTPAELALCIVAELVKVRYEGRKV
ncbi:MAG: XdhC family protein [Coriobacteriales bacterium]|jgi:xanthine dehydrogenase accessory factor|nr:XdhC family protein [Coriobacteriales bacterium]